jgi:hypothetical protein
MSAKRAQSLISVQMYSGRKGGMTDQCRSRDDFAGKLLAGADQQHRVA